MSGVELVDPIEPPDAIPTGANNPAQMEVLAALGARPHERPEFDPRLRHELRDELEERLTPLAEQLPDGDTLWVSKHLLSSVHGCEAMFLAREAEEFAWTPANARGVVSHKAIELVGELAGRPGARPARRRGHRPPHRQQRPHLAATWARSARVSGPSSTARPSSG